MAQGIDELASDALDGNEVAWKQLCHQLTPRLAALFHRLGAPASDIEDLIQETWLKFLKHGRQFDASRHFEPYIFTIATRCWYDLCRRSKRSPGTWYPPEGHTDAHPLPHDLLFALDLAQQIQTCLNHLNDEEKTILVLRFWQELTNQEIAERLNLTEPSVRSKGYRALRKLADCVQV